MTSDLNAPQIKKHNNEAVGVSNAFKRSLTVYSFCKLREN